MGIYVNPGNRQMQKALNDEIYVDKSMILKELNKKFDTGSCFMCVSRPRRFGKTMVGNLISAFYSRGADSRAIFEKLKFAGEPGWDERLNKFNVIQIDLGSFFSRYHETGNIIGKLTELVVKDMRKEFPDVEIPDDAPIAEALVDVYCETQIPFVVIIDEYDVMVREQVSQKEFQSYLELLNSLFKGAECCEAISLAYITGIMPIVRDRVQSKLNNFDEFTMLTPQELAPYIGFTTDEVKDLCAKHKIDYDECLRWYDGYRITPEVSICNSNSVCKALKTKVFDDYWSKTGAYDVINNYIRLDFENIKEDISTMIGGGRVEVNVTSFSNRLSDLNTKDKVFTYLIHLGYLVFEKGSDGHTYCKIPNGEVRNEWKNAVEDMADLSQVFKMIRNSERLLQATIDRDEQAVADALDKAHEYVTSAQTYNNEGSLQSAVGLAYFSATSRYDINKELAGGRGFADIAFKPYVPGAPGIIIELKMDQPPEVGLAQIKKKGYIRALGSYTGPVYLVAISYGKESKKHKCKIEVVEKQ